MKLNNKGFTLIEVLVVIVILAVIGGIAVGSILSTINNSKNLSYSIMIENIKTASKVLYEEVESYDMLDYDKELQEGVLYDYDINGERDIIKINEADDSITIHLQALVTNGFLEGTNNNCNSSGTENINCNKNKKIIINPKTKDDIGNCEIVINLTDGDYSIDSKSTDDKCPSTNEYRKS